MSSPDQPTPPSGWGEAPRPPAYGQYGPGQYGGGQYGAGQPGPVPGAPAPGHGQAPQSPYPPNPYGQSAQKPGIVPLRPLSLGEIFDGAFTAVRHNPRVMLGMVTLLVTVATVLAAVLAQFVVPLIAPVFTDALTAEPELAAVYGSDGGAFTQLVAITFAMILTLLVAQPFCEGLVSISVSQSVIGRRLGPGETWQRFRPRLGVLMLWLLVRIAAVAVGLVAYAVVVALVIGGAVELGGSPWLAVALVILSYAALVALIFWLTVRTLLVTPALALERAGLWSTVARAWRLTRKSFWRIFGTYLLASIIASLAGQVVITPLFVLGFAIDGGVPGWGTVLLATMATVVSYVVLFVFVAGVVALIYTDVRMRREGLDVRLAEAAAREAARGTVPGPGAGPQPPAAPGPQW